MTEQQPTSETTWTVVEFGNDRMPVAAHGSFESEASAVAFGIDKGVAGVFHTWCSVPITPSSR